MNNVYVIIAIIILGTVATVVDGLPHYKKRN